jgi:hypothetical protein
MKSRELEISLHSGSPGEAATRDQLERLLQEHDLSQWIFTRRVSIAEGEIPHSHPLLTINTRYLNDDLAQVATFLHEQFHWLVASTAEERVRGALEDFRATFPDIPAAPPEAAHDRESTYLHLVVCDLEFEAMSAVFGASGARGLLKSWPFYTWIYQQVLSNPEVRKINERHGFRLKP